MSLRLFNTKKFDSWRAEEKPLVNRYLKGVRSAYVDRSMQTVKRKLSDGYLLRDIIVAMLEKHAGRYNTDDIRLISTGLQSVIGVEVDLYNVVRSSMELWSGDNGYNSVQNYMTPKSLIYTLRGDYQK